MNDDTLATELLRTLKGSIKRLYIIIIILISLLFVSNIAWLYAWNLPEEETISEVSQEADDSAINNYVGNVGDINGGGD